MALLVLLATEPEFNYTAEDLALISKDSSHQFNKNKRLWYTCRKKKENPATKTSRGYDQTVASMDSFRGKQAHPDILQDEVSCTRVKTPSGTGGAQVCALPKSQCLPHYSRFRGKGTGKTDLVSTGK